MVALLVVHRIGSCSTVAGMHVGIKNVFIGALVFLSNTAMMHVLICVACVVEPFFLAPAATQ
jgi:hypothetical protein